MKAALIALLADVPISSRARVEFVLRVSEPRKIDGDYCVVLDLWFVLPVIRHI